MGNVEFWADVVIDDQLEKWLLDQGASVYRSYDPPIFKKGKWIDAPPIVMFGGRQIYYYNGSSKLVRIFFNASNESSRTLLLLQFPNAIKAHNFKDMTFTN